MGRGWTCSSRLRSEQEKPRRRRVVELGERGGVFLRVGVRRTSSGFDGVCQSYTFSMPVHRNRRSKEPGSWLNNLGTGHTWCIRPQTLGSQKVHCQQDEQDHKRKSDLIEGRRHCWNLFLLGICLLLSGRNEQRKPGNELCASLSSLEEPGRSLTLVETAILVSRALVYYQMATKK